jgi:hypothetical protein
MIDCFICINLPNKHKVNKNVHFSNNEIQFNLWIMTESIDYCV